MRLLIGSATLRFVLQKGKRSWGLSGRVGRSIKPGANLVDRSRPNEADSLTP
jgi:hypothetical protein